jgi:hypothetical protein
MRATPLLFAILVFAGCTTSGGKELPPTGDTSKPVYYPYRARMAISPSPQNSAYTLKVLQYWKAYESGEVLSMEPIFADSVTLVYGEKLVTGDKATVVKYLQQQRSALGATQCYIDFWNNVYSEDRNEPWVMLWAQVVAGSKNALGPAHAVQQVWKFNPEGKVYYLHQYFSRFQW